LAAAAWVIVPLLAQRDWAATNEILRGGPLENGYGAGRVLGWLVSGQVLDYGRIPVVTVFAAVGLGVALYRCRRDPDMRALLVALGVCLLLSFGRATFGAVTAVLPGAGDIFFRRFMMGVQLVALLLAGRGAAWAATEFRRTLVRTRFDRDPAWPGPSARDERLFVAAALAAIVALLAPAWLQLGSYDRRNAAAIAQQQRADAAQGAAVDRLLATVRRRGGGRVYAGMPSNWGSSFTVGAVPVFKYLEARDVDEVGYTLRTASLMTDPEFYLDERNPSDYRLFGIHYLILPAGAAPPVSARLVEKADGYALWTLPARGVVQVGEIAGTIAADRTNVGLRSIPLLRSALPQRGRYLRVRYGEAGEVTPLPRDRATDAGAVSSERDRLSDGAAAATVRMRRPGVAVLSASFDPGWTATVDGRSRPTEMIAPALVGVAVPAGTHRVVFRYRGYGGYPLLLVICGLTFVVLLLRPVARQQHRRRTPVS
jgi:hypothetical protein